MFKWFNDMEKAVGGAIASVTSSKMAAAVIRGAKVAVGYELAYVLTHVSDPTSGSQWKSAAVAGALLGMQKYLTWQDNPPQA